MSDWAYAGLVAYWLALLAVPAIGMVALAAHIDGFIRIPWMRTAQGMVLLVGLTFTGQSQTRPVWADELDRLRGQMEGHHSATNDRLSAIEQRLSNHVGRPWHEDMHEAFVNEQGKRDKEHLAQKNDVSELRSLMFHLMLWMMGGFGTLALGGGVVIHKIHKTNQQVVTQIRQNGGHVGK